MARVSAQDIQSRMERIADDAVILAVGINGGRIAEKLINFARDATSVTTSALQQTFGNNAKPALATVETHDKSQKSAPRYKQRFPF